MDVVTELRDEGSPLRTGGRGHGSLGQGNEGGLSLSGLYIRPPPLTVLMDVLFGRGRRPTDTEGLVGVELRPFRRPGRESTRERRGRVREGPDTFCGSGAEIASRGLEWGLLRSGGSEGVLTPRPSCPPSRTRSSRSLL